MSILLFVPMTLIAIIIERPRQPRRRSAYRKQSHTIHHGRSY